MGSLVTCLGNVAPQTMRKTTGAATALTQPVWMLLHTRTYLCTSAHYNLFVPNMLTHAHIKHIFQICCHSQTVVHTRKSTLTNAGTPVEAGQIAVAEDTWWNHQSQEPPSGQMKFVLV